jgi:hypothetical protein
MDIFFFLSVALVIIFVCTFVYCGFLLIDIKHDIKDTRRTLNNLKRKLEDI